jgi:hypothetical protein
MSWTTFRVEAPANCQFANMAGLMHSAGVSPVAVLGGLTGFSVAEASEALEFIDRYFDEHLQRAWGLSLPWHTVHVNAETTAVDLAEAIQAFEPRQEEGVLVGFSIPIVRAVYRTDLRQELSIYHYFLRCVHAPGAVTTIDATPTREMPTPLVIERTDTLDSLIGGEPFDFFLNRPWDVIVSLRQRHCVPDDLMASAVSAFRADLKEHAEGRAPTLQWVARRWAALTEQPDNYFSPHNNIFKVIDEHRIFLPNLLRAATREGPDTAGLLSELHEIRDQYKLIINLCFKLDATRLTEHRHRIIASGARILDRLLESERRWTLAALRATG